MYCQALPTHPAASEAMIQQYKMRAGLQDANWGDNGWLEVDYSANAVPGGRAAVS